jgi:hypothetical protein
MGPLRWVTNTTATTAQQSFLAGAAIVALVGWSTPETITLVENDTTQSSRRGWTTLDQHTTAPRSVAQARDVALSTITLREGALEVLGKAAWLLPLLHEVAAALRAHFNSDCDVVVEPFQHDDDGEATLFASVRTSLDAEAAAKRMDAFYDTWWLDNLRRFHGRVDVTVEFA